ncbi:MAG: hypothetical protein J6J39_05375 [Clostridia bacterium]|nr:hypothetical protein [Clostridia bacterium]
MKSVNLRKIVATVLTAVLLICMVCVTTSAAVSYKGKGSKSNPYIVETVEQLDGMRNNLKAHYKLGNTIDLSTVANFKPIGTLDAPFKGTFVCDLDESGKPKFAIKNLKIEIAPAGCTKAEKFSGYKENKSGWEAGLFGCGSGATIKNILVLDATVVSKVEGCYMMNSDYTINPGTNEQGAGILMAIGKKVTITGCGVSGTVTAACNHVGGMLGLLEGSKVSKSYSYANVTSTGAWGSGGLIGSMNKKSSVNTSFYSGTFSGGQTHAGAFAGDCFLDATVTDCWAEGTVLTEDSGCFAGTKNHSDDSDLENVDVCKNTYTLAKIEGRKNAQSNKKVKNNNYITNEVGGFEMGFAAASQQEMNEAFKSLSNWVVKDGTYPQLKGIVPVKDASVYVVNEVTDEVPEDTASENQATQEDTQTSNGDKKAEVETNVIEDDSLMRVSTPELILIIVLSSLIVAAVIGSGITMVLILKKKS